MVAQGDVPRYFDAIFPTMIALSNSPSFDKSETDQVHWRFQQNLFQLVTKGRSCNEGFTLSVGDHLFVFFL